MKNPTNILLNKKKLFVGKITALTSKYGSCVDGPMKNKSVVIESEAKTEGFIILEREENKKE